MKALGLGRLKLRDAIGEHIYEDDDKREKLGRPSTARWPTI
jgi:hypothetical protein